MQSHLTAPKLQSPLNIQNWGSSRPPSARPFDARTRLSQKHVVAAATAAPPQTSFVLHVDQTSISFPLKPESGKELNEGLQVLLQTFADKQKAERPQRWKSMEFRVKGEAEKPELDLFEVFCNPNSASSAFTAKALITLRTRDGVKMTTEGTLSALKEDLDLFLSQTS